MIMFLFEVRTQLPPLVVMLLVAVAAMLVGTTYSSTTLLPSAQGVFTSTRRAVILHGPIRQVRRLSGLSGQGHTLQLLPEDLDTDLITIPVLLVLGKFARACCYCFSSISTSKSPRHATCAMTRCRCCRRIHVIKSLYQLSTRNLTYI